MIEDRMEIGQICDAQALASLKARSPGAATPPAAAIGYNSVVCSAVEGIAMKVFVFDLLAYGEQLDHLKVGGELPYPLAKRHFTPEIAARTYAEHLAAWEELDRLGYDGVG